MKMFEAPKEARASLEQFCPYLAKLFLLKSFNQLQIG
jgi:hypothetical protein